MKGYQVMIFLAAFVARMTFVPHVVPIAAVEELQPLWALELTFLLRALEKYRRVRCRGGAGRPGGRGVGRRRGGAEITKPVGFAGRTVAK